MEALYVEAQIKAETAASVEEVDGEERCLAKIMRSYGQVGGMRGVRGVRCVPTLL